MDILGSPKREEKQRNERPSVWKGRAKTFLIHGWHDHLGRKSNGMHKNSTRIYEFSKNGRVQNHYAQISFIYAQYEIENVQIGTM